MISSIRVVPAMPCQQTKNPIKIHIKKSKNGHHYTQMNKSDTVTSLNSNGSHVSSAKPDIAVKLKAKTLMGDLLKKKRAGGGKDPQSKGDSKCCSIIVLFSLSQSIFSRHCTVL
jgi:hypothetical protein